MNVGIRFLLELLALGILGYWGYTLDASQLAKLGLGLGIPLTVAVVWRLLVSPAAPYRLEQPWRADLEVLILGGAAGTLYFIDRSIYAVGFGIVAALNTALLSLLGQL